MNCLLQDELRLEAATSIQWWFRRIAYMEWESSDDSPSSESSDDDNSADAVAIRRAFICSTASTNPGTAAPDSADRWSHTEILDWVSRTLHGTRDNDDRLSSIKAVWLEWEKANPFFPQHMRTRIVKTIDETMHEQGFPSLRELLDMI